MGHKGKLLAHKKQNNMITYLPIKTYQVPLP